MFLFLMLLGINHSTFANKTEILCPARYKNESILIDETNLRYQSGSRIKDEQYWRYPTGQRMVDDQGVLRYLHGQRLVDGKIWRYQNGSRLLDENVFRYPNGKVMRDETGVFKDQEGKTLNNESFEYAFTSDDGSIIRILLTKNHAEIVMHVKDQQHEYQFTFDPQKELQPKKLECRLNNLESVGQKFSITSKAALVEVNVLSGKDSAKVKEAIEKALKSIE